MVDGQANSRFSKIAEKWRDLADKRRAHYVELYRSGRWKLYYSETEFVLRMREVNRNLETWAALAGQATDKPAAVQEPEESGVLPPRQTAA